MHLHYFGTMKISFPDRPTYQTGDEIEIRFNGMGAALVNYVRQIPVSKIPVGVEKG